LSPKLPPPDPNESLELPAGDTPLRAPTVVFAMGPPSPQADRASDAILNLRPGLLVVVDAG
jgi:hypothetical protein